MSQEKDDTAHTIDAQINHLQDLIKARQASIGHDQEDVNFALQDSPKKIDTFWAGYHARLTLPIDGAD